MAEHGKKYEESAKKVDRTRQYTVPEAAALAKEVSYAKFDETMELHLTMGVDPKKADQQVRGIALLPHGLGKKVRVLVFAQGEAAENAQKAGADYVGSDDLVKKVQEGWTDFEVAIATPDMMSKLGRLGPVLGRKGLMPNPKSGTVVQPADIAGAVGNARKGRVEFRLDKSAIIHVPVGKRSFQTDQLSENINSLMQAVVRAKPSTAKGSFIVNATLKSTMGPGIPLDTKAATSLKTE
jgi:large subunit ribosomal protein L1